MDKQEDKVARIQQSVDKLEENLETTKVDIPHNTDKITEYNTKLVSHYKDKYKYKMQ